MASDSTEADPPMTPAGRLFLQDRMNVVINCAIAAEHPLASIDTIKAEILNSGMLKHPRFRSLMVRDSWGREHWRRTQVDVDRHLVIRDHRLTDDPTISEDDVINDYLAELACSSPLARDKPLWEIHILVPHRAVVMRFHHALGDGVSLMSLLLSCCRRVDNPEEPPSMGGVSEKKKAPEKRWSVWALLCMIWFTLVYSIEAALMIGLMRDRKTALSGGAGVEHWPRRVVTARFKLDDLKTVKRAVHGTTINDVVFGLISSALSRYLDIQSPNPNEIKDGLRMTGVAMVNVRQQPGLQDLAKLMNGELGTRWGNKFSIMLLPVYYGKRVLDPLQFVKKAKQMIDRKKMSLDSYLSYKINALHTFLMGAKFTSDVNYRLLCNTTFSFSNIVGPKERISLTANPLKYIRVTTSGMPHALSMHMVSYAGYVDMQVLVAKEIIQDPKVLAKLFEDTLLEMKEAAEAAMKPVTEEV